MFNSLSLPLQVSEGGKEGGREGETEGEGGRERRSIHSLSLTHFLSLVAEEDISQANCMGVSWWTPLQEAHLARGGEDYTIYTFFLLRKFTQLLLITAL